MIELEATDIDDVGGGMSWLAGYILGGIVNWVGGQALSGNIDYASVAEQSGTGYNMMGA
jgi:hypothetical protein